MRPSFYPRTINGPFDDPGVFIPFLFEKRAIIFDIGNIYALSPGDMLKITHVFVSHTHMDHFVGFDRLLRVLMGREKELYLYGPEGFLKNVEGKLAGYSWNLVAHYTGDFVLHATEVRSDCLLSRRYICRNKFLSTEEPREMPFSNVLHTESSLSVSTAILDHDIPCLGFSLDERFHVNILKDRLDELGLETGPWLKDFKQALFREDDPDTVFEIRCGRENVRKRQFVLGELAEKIATITPGQKVSYVTDAVYSKSNAEKIILLSKDSDYLFIEAAFLDEDRDMARQKYHLTARQAGTLAKAAGVRQIIPFHFSPRYTGMGHLLEAEAERAWMFDV